MDAREEKGLIIAAKSKITRKGGLYLVPSQSGPGKYEVDPKAVRCTCPDFELRGERCKHLFATEIVIERERSVTETTDGNTTVRTVTEKVRVTYSQNWTAYNTAQTYEKALFQRLLAELCSPIADPPQTKGRPRLSYRDMIFAVAFKVYSTVSGRRFISDLTDAHAKGYISKVPHFNSIFNYLELPGLTPILHELITRSALPLKALETSFAVDSSGFSTCQYARWFDAKYGKEMAKHEWIKVHLMCGTETHVVTSVEVTGAYVGDSPQFPGLVMKTAQNFNVEQVSADKAYSSLDNHQWVAAAGGTPFIAFKKNTVARFGGLFEKMFHYFCFNREAFLEHYHKRSNVETAFSMIKAKFGGKIRSKTETAQENEALCKVLCHNLCCLIQSMFEFGIDPSFCAENSPAQKVG